MFRALGDPVRQRMLGLLEARGELCVSDLVRQFRLAQPSISHHLRVLREAGLVTARKDGKAVYYAIDPQALGRCCSGFFSRFAGCRPWLRKAARAAGLRSDRRE